MQWDAVVELMSQVLSNRSWWSRLWIVQEVVIAKAESIIHCGKEQRVIFRSYLLSGLLLIAENSNELNHQLSIFSCPAIQLACKEEMELYLSQYLAPLAQTFCSGLKHASSLMMILSQCYLAYAVAVFDNGDRETGRVSLTTVFVSHRTASPWSLRRRPLQHLRRQAQKHLRKEACSS